jgi:hypothetical protein
MHDPDAPLRPDPRLNSSPVADERRRATRFHKEPETEFAVLWIVPGEPILAEVHDESLGGLGLVVDDGIPLAVGDVVDVVYAGDLLKSVVRHIQEPVDGRRLVGIECQLPARGQW